MEPQPLRRQRIARKILPGAIVASAAALSLALSDGRLTVADEVASLVGNTPGSPVRLDVEAAPRPFSGASQARYAATAIGPVVQTGQENGGTAPARQFNPAAVEVSADDSVQWVIFDNDGGKGHDVQAYDGSFSSGPKSGMNTIGQTFERAFPSPGTYTYYCSTHAGPGDADPARIDERIAEGKMAGKIVVTEVPPPGELAVATQPIVFGSLTISGFDQDMDAVLGTWRVSDTTGNGIGWTITLFATDFSTAGGTIPAGNLRVQLPQAAIQTVTGNAPPSTQAPVYQPLDPVAPLRLLSAAPGAGMGVYDFVPDFRLTVPAEAVPGTYTSALTVTLNTGP